MLEIWILHYALDENHNKS